MEPRYEPTSTATMDLRGTDVPRCEVVLRRYRVHLARLRDAAESRVQRLERIVNRLYERADLYYGSLDNVSDTTCLARVSQRIDYLVRRRVPFVEELIRARATLRAYDTAWQSLADCIGEA